MGLYRVLFGRAMAEVRVLGGLGMGGWRGGELSLGWILRVRATVDEILVDL